MSQKKTVRRSIALGLVVICIILIALIAVIYISAQNSYNNLQDQNQKLQAWLNGNETLLNQTSITAFNSLNSAYNNYVSAHSHTDSDYNSLSTQKTNLQGQVNNLSDIVNLKKSIVWANHQTLSNAAGRVVRWAQNMSVSYAGYIGVQVNSLTGNNSTFVEVAYSSSSYSGDSREVVGVSGSVAFPILPTTNLSVSIGTLDGSAAMEQVTMVYIY
jgi:uncharacterized protein YpmS